MIRCLRAATVCFCLSPALCAGADVEPRLYSNVPVGVNLLTLAYAHSDGDVTFDSSVPAQDVEGRVNLLVASYSRGLDVFGRSGLLSVAIPYGEVRLEGLYLGAPASGTRRGFGDPGIRLAVNLWGAPALTPEEFATYRQKTIVGASVTVTPPLGHYDAARVINTGTNRWSVLGQFGASHRSGPWTFESALGVQWLSDNDEFRGSAVLEQEPIALYRGAIQYDLTPAAWVGAGWVYAYGGETSLNGVEREDRLGNWRIGLSLSFVPVRNHRIQLKVTDGIVSRIGQDFRTFGISYTRTF